MTRTGKKRLSLTRAGVERIKSLAIVLLTVSALFFAWTSGVFDGMYSAIVGTAAETPSSISSVAAEAARPLAVVVTNNAAQRALGLYGDAESDVLYERARGVLGATLGSADAPEYVSENVWRAALSEAGVMFEYHEPVRLDVVAGWLGAAVPDWSGDYVLRRICVNFNGALYFATDDAFYRAQTESFVERPGLAASYADGVRYAFELDGNSSAPYVIVTDRYAYPAAISVNPLLNADTLTDALTALGVPRGHKSSYLDADGAQVYVTSNFNVSVASGGVVTFRRTDETPRSILTPGEMIETARRAVQPCAGYAGVARLYCSGAEFSGGGAVITFDYYLNGARVFFENGSAARVELRGGVVASMTLRFRTYAFLGETITLLPPLQTLAAADSEFRLGYYDGAVMPPFWWEVGE